jgi:hypothetical protein
MRRLLYQVMYLLVRFLLIFLLIISGPLLGAVFADEGRPRPSLDLSAEYVGRAAVDRGDDSFAVTHSAARLEWLVALFEYHHLRYDWRVRDGETEPWGSLERLKPGLQYLYRYDEQWGVWPKVVAISGYEDSPSSRSWTWNPQLIGFYQARPHATVYFGAGSLYHPVDPVYYPVLGLALNPRNERGLSGAIGFPETVARYRFAEHIAVKMDFGWKIRSYRLDDDNPRAPAGYLRTEDRVPGLHVEYTTTRGVTFSPGVRWHLGRSVTLYDERERKIESSNVRSAWSAVFQVKYVF